jgi:hypothetical protein
MSVAAQNGHLTSVMLCTRLCMCLLSVYLQETFSECCSLVSLRLSSPLFSILFLLFLLLPPLLFSLGHLFVASRSLCLFFKLAVCFDPSIFQHLAHLFIFHSFRPPVHLFISILSVSSPSIKHDRFSLKRGPT